MEKEISEQERARNAALAFAIQNSGTGAGRLADNVVADAEKFYKFLIKKD